MPRTSRLASQNPHKLAELREALPEWELEPLDAEGYPEETGATYTDNARLKARYGASVEPDVWIIGEDSGIECAALGGEPGLHSARWAPGRDQADALLERMAGESDRRARMVAEIVAVSPGGEEVDARGELDGDLALERRGTAGFGYDPIFIPRGYDRTVAELGDEWKREHSHRALAARALERALRNDGTS